jgi:mono/diheme cytochrome c family protein
LSRYRTVRALSVCVGSMWSFPLMLTTDAPRLAPNSQAAAGRTILAQSCAWCHEVDSRNQLVGPGLKGYYTGHYPAPNNAAVREHITRGKATMPGFSSFSDTELTDLIAYLRTL